MPVNLILIVQLGDILLISLVYFELSGNGRNSFIGDIMIMNEPIEVVMVGRSYVISHDFFESFFIGNYEQVYHDNVAYLFFVDKIRDA